MVSEYPCDNADGNLAVFTVSNQTNGDTQFWCVLCTAMFGTALLREAFPEVYKDMTAADVAPPAAPKKPRAKKAAGDDVDVNRTIATITEDKPRPPGDGPTETDDAPPY